MRTIFTLFLAMAAASALEPAAESYNEHRLLRGPNDTEDNEDRDLLTLGSSSQSFSFSAVSSYGKGGFCIDYKTACLEAGFALTAASTFTDASGNAIAFAESAEFLFLQAFCDSFASAYALTCAFTRVDGDIEVDTKMVNRNQVVTLGLNLKAASTTFAKAESLAVADAYTGITASAFTDVKVFCGQVGNSHPFCGGGGAGTELLQIATAEADSFAVASALASADAEAKAGAFVVTSGSKYSYVKGLLSAYVKAWTFAEAGATAEAFASSFTEVINDSWAAFCFKQYASLCADNTIGFCGYDANKACASAEAKGFAFADALALACAEAFVIAFAKAQSFIFLTADIDLGSVTPALTWTTTNAGIANSCSA
jgi:hypothetical protein